MVMRPRSLRVYDMHPSASDFEAEVVAGLSLPQKVLPYKYFYDAEGATLFEAICATKEYYLTRCELEIFQARLPDIARLVGPKAVVIEPGSGNGAKTRRLLEALDAPAAYVPVDLSRAQLFATAAEIAAALGELEVLPVCADYTQPFPLPGTTAEAAGRKVVFYPGSTIGNFDRPDAERFLRRMAERVGPGGAIILGVDLKKDPALLHAAYNDELGLTARFNKNLLVRIATSLDADVDVEGFAHYAFYNPVAGRMEMHLVSLKPQAIRVGASKFQLATGESIWTENSYKYTRPEVRTMGTRAGLTTLADFMDDKGWFLVSVLGVPG